MRATRWSLLVAVTTLITACSAGTADVTAPEPPPVTAPADPAEPTIGETVAEAPAVPLEAAVPELSAPGAAEAPVVEDDPIFPGLVPRVGAAPRLGGPAPAGEVRTASGPLRGNPRSTGRIEIPAIGLNHRTYEGIDLPTIDHGPSHWPGTPLPGQLGNTVFPGHRTTHSRPFWDMDRLVPGNEVIFSNSTGRFTYRVREVFIVNANETWVVNNTPDATFTIIACHPKGSARQRIVAKGNLVSAPLAPPAPPKPAPTPTPRQKFLGIL